MNRLCFAGVTETVSDEDAVRFYEMISSVIGDTLSPTADTIVLMQMDKHSRSSQSHMILCKIKEDRYVVLKRCFDNLEFIRREAIIAEAKKRLGFPSYGVLPINGLSLRSFSTSESSQLTKGWGQKSILVIDYGNYKSCKNLTELPPSDIRDMEKFCFDYGKAAAFNYLLGVRDRNSGNFVYFLDTRTLHSVDNEEGPFDSNGNEIGVMDIVDATRQNIEKFIAGPNRSSYVRLLREGFQSSWDLISQQADSLNILQQREMSLFKKRLQDDPDRIAMLFFP